MQELFSLGELYPSDFLKSDEEPRSSKIEMKLMLDDTGNVRLEKTAALNNMYGRYWYRSGINVSMKNELQNIVNSILNVFTLKENDLWIDVASNDGTLLSSVSDKFIRVGIDPADDTYKVEAEKHSNLIIQDFFSAKTFQKSKFGNLKAKVITSIAMFYDLEHPEKFITDIGEILDDHGLWVLQLSYTPLMLLQLAFDNICHEHIYYYSLCNIKKLLENSGFKIMDCQLNDTNGGSFRIYCMKQKGDCKYFGSQPYRDVCNFRIHSLLKYENELNLDRKATWMSFFEDIENLKHRTFDFITTAKANGKSIWGYGASTKGNTLLQYFDLNNSLIDGIAERSPYKWGLRTIGTNIPIFSEQEMREKKPDYLLVLPWHFINEFFSRERDLLEKGTKFIVPCPKFEIIGL